MCLRDAVVVTLFQPIKRDGQTDSTFDHFIGYYALSVGIYDALLNSTNTPRTILYKKTKPGSCCFSFKFPDLRIEFSPKTTICRRQLYIMHGLGLYKS